MLGLNSFGFNAKNVNEKVLQIFKQSFPRAEHVAWSESRETYSVNFVEEGIRTSVIYDKNGEFLEATRYYEELNLPLYLLYRIKERYPDKKIYGITEVSTPDEILYYVKMVDSKIWLTLRIDSEGRMILIEKFRKAA
jgi:hypothetical protein